MDIFKLVSGNPGCLVMIATASKELPTNHFMRLVAALTRNGITGSRAYMLWNDAARQHDRPKGGRAVPPFGRDGTARIEIRDAPPLTATYTP